jgi:radical SAM protein with 4Fe4S-binding SPASM domain
VQLRSYSDFSAAIQGRGSAARIPMNVTFEVTRRCPLTCSHCYNNLPVGDRAARDAELSLDQHRRLLDELADLGCLWLLYTGGEIFARRDFLDIYRYARGKGFLITLFTNGTMITPAIADELVRHRPFAIEITLYGATRETYEKLTGVEGSYDRCIRGINLLLERKLPLRLKTVAVTVNKHELGDIRRFAEGLGVEFKLDAMMSPRIDCSQSPLEVRLLPEEVVELDVRDEKRMAEWELFAQLHMGAEQQQARHSEQVYQCGGGVSSFAVDPSGGMSICVLSQNDKFDLAGGSVRVGWEEFLRKVRSRTVTRATKCTDCGLKAMCGMCPANGELESSDPETPVEFLCQVAHLRAYTFGFPVPAHGECDCCSGQTHTQLLGWAERLKKAVPGAPLAQRRPRGLALVDSKRETEDSCGGGCASCR